MIHRIEPDPGLRQAIADSLGWKSRPVLDAPEALFLRGGDNLSVTHEACGCIAVVGVEAEDVHRWTGAPEEEWWAATMLVSASARLGGRRREGAGCSKNSALVVRGREAPVKSR